MATATFPRPKIVCLCGSMRFYRTFLLANRQESLAGHIVLTPAHVPTPELPIGVHAITTEQKAFLDELYLRKIELADEILVLNVGGWIGESTSREISHAKALGKPIRYWEAPSG